MKNENTKLSLFECIGIIVGHGVGAGILSVPYLTSLTSWSEFIIVVIIAFLVNVLLHLMISELSYNYQGAQFVTCFEKSLFKENSKAKKIIIPIIFAGLAFSVIMNVCAYISGSSIVIASWLNCNAKFAMVIYFLLVGILAIFGLKIVGILEKYSVYLMIAVMLILTIAVCINGSIGSLGFGFTGIKEMMALYGMVSFALSAVMSTPQVVKGTGLDIKKTRISIIVGELITITLVIVLTIITILGTSSVTQNGAIVDLSNSIGGWVKQVGNVFTLLALSTSLWANTLDLRDVIFEKIKINKNYCWMLASIPCLVVALLGAQTFVGFTRLASAIQVLTSIGIIFAFSKSRKIKIEHEMALLDANLSLAMKKEIAINNTITKKYGSLVFQIIVVIFFLIATIGSII